MTDEFDDLEGSVYRWLPVITQLFPGCGITVHTVWLTPLEWWRIYVQHAQQSLEANRG